MIGGLIRKFADAKFGNKEDESGKGILFCSGLIAGEGIIGVLLAILKVAGITDKMDLSSVIPTGNAPALILIVLITAAVYKAAMGKKNEK
jgi:hypothetical protein